MEHTSLILLETECIWYPEEPGHLSPDLRRVRGQSE